MHVHFRLDDLISSKSGYRNYRALLETCLSSGQPTLPFMSVMLKDLFSMQQVRLACDLLHDFAGFICGFVKYSQNWDQSHSNVF